MKIQTSKQNLLKCVQSVQNAVSSKTTLPILSNILIETTDDGIKMVGTDLDLGISAHTQAQVIQPGGTTIPARKFSDIIKELPDTTVTIEVKKNNVIIIDCEKSFFKLMGLPKDEFPKFPEFVDQEMLQVPQKTLKWMLSVTSFAMSHEETRYVLNGVYFSMSKGCLEVVATDGRRLALVQEKVGDSLATGKAMIIPTKTVQELMRNLSSDEGDLTIIFGDRQVMFEVNNLVIISRLIDGEYPNYRQVIPKQTHVQFDISREQLLLATRRVGLFTNDESKAIKIDLLKGKMIISKNTPELGEAREEIPIEYAGETFSIGFNPFYLIDMLKSVDQENIKVELSGPDKPGVMKTTDDYTYVILPMQLV